MANSPALSPSPPTPIRRLWSNYFDSAVFPSDLPSTSSINRLSELCDLSASNTAYPQPRQLGPGSVHSASLSIEATSADEACDKLIDVVDRCVRSGDFTMLLTDERTYRM